MKTIVVSLAIAVGNISVLAYGGATVVSEGAKWDAKTISTTATKMPTGSSSSVPAKQKLGNTGDAGAVVDAASGTAAPSMQGNSGPNNIADDKELENGIVFTEINQSNSGNLVRLIPGDTPDTAKICSLKTGACADATRANPGDEQKAIGQAKHPDPNVPVTFTQAEGDFTGGVQVWNGTGQTKGAFGLDFKRYAVVDEQTQNDVNDGSAAGKQVGNMVLKPIPGMPGVFDYVAGGGGGEGVGAPPK